jgi:hypothetical protein
MHQCGVVLSVLEEEPLGNDWVYAPSTSISQNIKEPVFSHK